MGVIQQGLNDAITGATFLINTSPGGKEMFESRKHLNTTKELARQANYAVAASQRAARTATAQFEIGVKEGSLKGRNIPYDAITAHNELDRAKEFAKAHEKSIREGLVKYPKTYSEFAARNTTVDLTGRMASAQKAFDRLYGDLQQYDRQKKDHMAFKDILKNQAIPDYDALVKMGINPNVAEAGIKEAEKRGEYNG